MEKKSICTDLPDFFGTLIREMDPEKGVTARDYLDALDFQVKVPLQVSYLELCELISALPEEEQERADGFLAIQRAALTLWEQIDKTVLANSNQEMPREAGK